MSTIGRKKRGLIAAVAITCSLGALTACGVDPGSTDTVRIGIPLGTSGKGADYGELSKIAAEMAAEEINDAGGIGGKDLELVFGDTHGENQEAVNLTRRMIDRDGVLAIVGFIFSGEVEQAFPVAAHAETPIISHSSAKPGIMEQYVPWGFRNTTTEDKLQQTALETWTTANAVSRVALVSDVEDAYSKDLGLNVFPTVLEDLGIDVVNADDPVTYTLGTTEFAPQVTKLADEDFDGVTIGGQYTDGALLIKEMRRQGIDAPVAGGVGFLSREFLEVGGSAVEGVTIGTSFWDENPDPAVQEFVNAFVERSGGSKPDYRAAAMYDTLFMLQDVIEEEGVLDIEDLADRRDAIRQGLSDLTAWTGVMGTTEFDDVGDASKDVYVLSVQDGEFKLAGSQ
jgi:branched-chain amino acid transport system substrate-binding protein